MNEVIKDHTALLQREEVIQLLKEVKKEGLSGYYEIGFYVSPSFKKLYDLYMSSKNTEEHRNKIMKFKHQILLFIIQELLSYSELQLDSNTLKELGLMGESDYIQPKLTSITRISLQREEVIELIRQLKEEGLKGYDKIKIHVSPSFKKLYDIYINSNNIEERRNKTMKLRYQILSFILQELMSYPELQLDSNILKELGLGSESDHNQSTIQVVVTPNLSKEKTPNKQLMLEFEKFINEKVLNPSNAVKITKSQKTTIEYVVPKEIADTVFKYISDLKLHYHDNTNVGLLLQELYNYLAVYVFNDNHIQNGAYHITVVQSEKIIKKLRQINRYLKI